MADKIVKRGISIYIDGKEVTNSAKGIRAEMQKLSNEQSKMTIGADNYIAHAKKIAYLDSLLKEHRENQRKVADEYVNMDKKSESYSKNSESRMSKMANGFNKYFALFTTFLASVTGITLGLKKFMDMRMELEDSSANLQSLTGLGDGDISWLRTYAKELSTTTTEAGVRITATSKDIMDGFTIIGSKRPELLKNKEAMADLTKQALTLAETGVPVASAFDVVTASLNQFDLQAKDGAEVINTIAAGSLAGSAEANNLGDSLKNVGTVAKDSNMTLGDTVAMLEVLASKQLLGEEAGTKMRGALLKLKEASVGYQSGAFNLRDALIEVNKQLDQKSSAAEKDALKAKLFGAENVTVGTIMLQNVDAYDKMREAVVGTNTAYDQAIIRTKTTSAMLAQAKNKFNEMGMELVQNLNPAMLKATNFGNNFLKMLIELPKWINENKGLLISMAAALGVYAFWVAAVSIAERKARIEKEISIALTKARTIADLAWCAVQQTLAGNFNTAGKAMKALNKEMFVNPYVALGVAIAAIAYSVYQFATHTTDAQKAMKEFNKESITQKRELNEIFEAYKKANPKTAEKAKLLQLIKEKYGPYIKNLIDEKGNIIDIDKAQQQANKSLSQSIALKIKNKYIDEYTSKEIEDQADIMTKIRDRIKDSKGESLANLIVGEIGDTMTKNINDPMMKGLPAIQNILAKYGLMSGVSDRREFGLMTASLASSYYRINQKTNEFNSVFKGLVGSATTVADAADGVNGDGKRTTTTPGGNGSYLDEQKQKKLIDSEMQQLEIDNLKAIADIKRKYLSGDIASEFDYNQKLLSQQDSYDASRKSKIEKLLKQITDPALRIELNKQLADINKTALDRQIEQNNQIKKIIEDADPIKAENDQYNNRLRELGLFESDRTKLTAEQLNARQLLEDQHNEKLRGLSTREATKKLRQLEKDQEDEEKLLADRRVKENMSEQKYADEKLKIEIDFLRKKLAVQGVSAKDIDTITKQLNEKLINSTINQYSALDSFKQKYGLSEVDRFKSQKEQEIAILNDFVAKGQLTEKDASLVRQQLFAAEFELKSKTAKQAAQEIASITGNLSSAMQGFQASEESSIELKYKKQIDAAKKAGKDTTKLEEQKNKELAENRAKWADKMFIVQVAGIVASTAAAAIDAYANAIKIPVVGLTLAPIAAGAAIAYGAAQVAQAEAARKQAKAGYYAGGWNTPDGNSPSGYTGGSDPREIRGFFPNGEPYHGQEFISNHHLTNNREMKPVFDLFEVAQRNGTAGSLTRNDLSKALRTSPGYYDGGWNSGASTSKFVDYKSDNNSSDDDLRYQLARLNDHLDKGINAPIFLHGPDGLVSRMKDYSNYINASKR